MLCYKLLTIYWDKVTINTYSSCLYKSDFFFPIYSLPFPWYTNFPFMLITHCLPIKHIRRAIIILCHFVRRRLHLRRRWFLHDDNIINYARDDYWRNESFFLHPIDFRNLFQCLEGIENSPIWHIVTKSV